MRVGIFGSRGFIGRNLVAYAAELGHSVVEFSTQNGKMDPKTGMLRHSSKFETIDAAIYLSQFPIPRSGRSNPVHIWMTNVVSSLGALEIVRQSGGTRLIYASTGNVYKPSFDAHSEDSNLDRTNSYSLSKIHAEESLLRAAGNVNVTCARLFTIYGPGQEDRLVPNLIKGIASGTPISLVPSTGEGNETEGLRLSICHVSDAVAILTLLLSVTNLETLNVCSSEITSIKSLGETIGSAIGRPPIFSVQSSVRSGNLIGNPALLQSAVDHSFVSVANGIGNMLDISTNWPRSNELQ